MPTVVFKLGGSLLKVPDLPARLRAVVQLWPAARPLLVVGGGTATDVVREWDRIHALGEERAHWLALASLALNDALLGALLPEACLVHDRPAAQAAWDAGRLPVLAALPFLRAEEQSLIEPHAPSEPSGIAAQPLPHDWNSTSDSVAAWIAARWPADELVLLKSVGWELPGKVGQSATVSRALDANFAPIAACLPRVSWVNLRAEPLVVQPYAAC